MLLVAATAVVVRPIILERKENIILLIHMVLINSNRGLQRMRLELLFVTCTSAGYTVLYLFLTGALIAKVLQILQLRVCSCNSALIPTVLCTMKISFIH